MTDLTTFLVAGTILFFFWAYGIVAFVRDVKNWVIPWYRTRRRRKAESEQREEREERERELL